MKEALFLKLFIPTIERRFGDGVIFKDDDDASGKTAKSVKKNISSKKTAKITWPTNRRFRMEREKSPLIPQWKSNFSNLKLQKQLFPCL